MVRLLALFGLCVKSSHGNSCMDKNAFLIGNFQSMQSGKCLIPQPERDGWRLPNTKTPWKIEMLDCPSKGNPMWNANDVPGHDIWTGSGGKSTSGCMNLLGGDATNGNKVGIWDCWESGYTGQNWRYDNESRAIYIVNSTKCLQSRTSTHSVEIWDCNGDDVQKWNFLPEDQASFPPPPPAQPPRFANDITIRTGDLCLDVGGGSSITGSPIQMWSCLNNMNQRWILDEWTLQLVYAGDDSRTHCVREADEGGLELDLCGEQGLSFYIREDRGGELWSGFAGSRCVDFDDEHDGVLPALANSKHCPTSRRWHFQPANTTDLTTRMFVVS